MASLTVAKKGPHLKRNNFVINFQSADVSGCETLLAAQGAGKQICLEGIVINCAAAITITIGEGETDSALTTTLLGPFVFTASGVNVSLDFGDNAIALTANTLLGIDGSGAGAVTVVAYGYVLG